MSCSYHHRALSIALSIVEIVADSSHNLTTRTDHIHSHHRTGCTASWTNLTVSIVCIPVVSNTAVRSALVGPNHLEVGGVEAVDAVGGAEGATVTGGVTLSAEVGCREEAVKTDWAG